MNFQPRSRLLWIAFGPQPLNVETFPSWREGWGQNFEGAA
jgi:hypothetical protein